MADAADARPVAALSKSGRKKRMKAERGGFSLPNGRPPVGKTWDPEQRVWVDAQGNKLSVEDQKVESKRKKEQKKNEKKKLRRALKKSLDAAKEETENDVQEDQEETEDPEETEDLEETEVVILTGQETTNFQDDLQDGGDELEILNGIQDFLNGIQDGEGSEEGSEEDGVEDVQETTNIQALAGDELSLNELFLNVFTDIDVSLSILFQATPTEMSWKQRRIIAANDLKDFLSLRAVNSSLLLKINGFLPAFVAQSNLMNVHRLGVPDLINPLPDNGTLKYERYIVKTLRTTSCAICLEDSCVSDLFMLSEFTSSRPIRYGTSIMCECFATFHVECLVKNIQGRSRQCPTCNLKVHLSVPKIFAAVEDKGIPP